MNLTTVTVHPFGSRKAFTLDLHQVYAQFQEVPEQRKRRGVRYPLAMLLTITLQRVAQRATADRDSARGRHGLRSASQPPE